MVTRIFVEGGGETNATRSRCRAAFATYIGKVVPNSRRRPSVVACGGRQEAYDDLCRALRRPEPDTLYVLLVDAEELADDRAAVDPWPHLLRRDGWHKPDGATVDQAQLMVVTVESWIVADDTALARYYGKGFRPNALPPPSCDLEAVQKADLYRALDGATRATKAGPYGKGHAFDLVGLIDPGKVEARCRRLAPRFHAFLRANCG